jgi:hypothetical protein
MLGVLVTDQNGDAVALHDLFALWRRSASVTVTPPESALA